MLEKLKKGDKIQVMQTQSKVFGYPVKAGEYIFDSWEDRMQTCYIRHKTMPSGKFLLIDAKCIELKELEG